MDREHRHVGNRLLHDRRRAHAEQMRRVHRAHHADPRRADAHVHEVDEPGAGETGRDLRALVGTEAVAVAGSPRRRRAGRRPRPSATDRGANRLEHLDREPEPVVERTAVLVGAAVVLGREELVDEIAVRGVDLDAVEARVGRVPGAATEVLDHLADLVALDRLRRLHVVRDARRRPHRQPRPGRVVHAAVVRELQERERAVLVDLLAHARGDAARTRDPTPRRCCASGTRSWGAPAPGRRSRCRRRLARTRRGSGRSARRRSRARRRCGWARCTS